MLPLSHIKVVELGGLAPVPMCGMILSDFGARVIRVDNTKAVFFDEVLNRGKQSICLDLKLPHQLGLLRRLIRTADVLLDPFRPGVLERLSLCPATLQADNPQLIVARLSGYGQPRPSDSEEIRQLRNSGGHDINYVAMSGVMANLGTKEQPQPPINLLADFAGGGMASVLGVLLAIIERTNSAGRGQTVDCSLTHACAYLSSFLWRGRDRMPMLWPNKGERASNVLDGGAPFYRCYRTKDGRFMAVGAIEMRFYGALLKLLGVSEEEAPQYNVQQWTQIATRFSAIFASKTSAEWMQAVQQGEDCCVTPVLGLDEAANLWPQDFIGQDRYREPGPQPRLSGSESRKVPLSRPVVGADTEEVLREVGCSEDDISKVLDNLRANM